MNNPSPSKKKKKHAVLLLCGTDRLIHMYGKKKKKKYQHVNFITICITFSVVPNGLNYGLWIFALMYLILNA